MIELEYHRLLAKYNVLKSSFFGDVPVIPDASEPMIDSYNLVLVDAHSHNVNKANSTVEFPITNPAYSSRTTICTLPRAAVRRPLQCSNKRSPSTL